MKSLPDLRRTTTGWIVLWAMLVQSVGLPSASKAGQPYSEPAKEAVEVGGEEADTDEQREGSLLLSAADSAVRTLFEHEATLVSPARPDSGMRAAQWCRPPPRA